MLPYCGVAHAEDARDLTWFLRRLRNLDHLPQIEKSHTALASTWDRTGGNDDGTDFKRIEGPRNILLDVDGPGCIHRIFVGHLEEEVADTRIQFYFDGSPTPTIDLPVNKFLDDRHGPIPYPLVFHKTYPGTLLPIPYARHARVQLYNEAKTHWGRYWQITYMTCDANTPIQTLTWPPSPAEAQEMQAVGARWLEAEKAPPEAPAKWSIEKQDLIAPDGSLHADVEKSGVVRQMRIFCDPDEPSLLQQVRLQMFWDNQPEPSVNAPLAAFFGYASVVPLTPATSPADACLTQPRYNSLVMGISGGEAYCCLPMPFTAGGRIELANSSRQPLKAAIKLLVESREVPPDWGRFHATWRAAPAALPDAPTAGEQAAPLHLLLEREGPGKYVGTMLQVIWPWPQWWGEGDWLIWTDESAWPPSYHGTGSEEYFNSGWGKFDHKAISGYVSTRGSVRSVYSFHLNDAFNFQQRIRVAVETAPLGDAQNLLAAHHPIWASTAFWYTPAAQPARSSDQTLIPEELPYVRAALASRPSGNTASVSTSPATQGH